MLITDRLEAFNQYLLHDESLQYRTAPIGAALRNLRTTIKEKLETKEIDECKELKTLLVDVKKFADLRNDCAHGYVVLSEAHNQSLEQRETKLQETAQFGMELFREFSKYTKKHIKHPKS